MKTIILSITALLKAKRTVKFGRYVFFINKTEFYSLFKKLHVPVLIFIMFASSFSMAQTQTASISGIVIDSSDEDPLTGATIYIEELKTGTVAGQNGEFIIDKLKEGTYTLSISYIGYDKHTESIKLEAGERKKHIFRLNANSQSLSEVVVSGKSEARQLREQAIAIEIDLNTKTIEKIEGLPLSDGYNILIETYRGEAIFASYGDKISGAFSYNPKTKKTKQLLTTERNLYFMCFLINNRR
jgi:hypothetical protein